MKKAKLVEILNDTKSVSVRRHVLSGPIFTAPPGVFSFLLERQPAHEGVDSVHRSLKKLH